jgi:hypothetical protein
MRIRLCICVALAAATLALFWPVGNCGFINYDDPLYVMNNPYVQGGMSWDSVRWAFSATHATNWHPLTWLSLMLDCQLYGLDPRGYHFSNLAFHIANTLLLFLLLNRMTGATWRSAFVAALFAMHPLHVESVAWVAERKDVLSAFFWFLTMLLYAGYAARPGFARYLLVVLSFAAGLMAKPMLVTLPFVLLLMDYWPLGRWGKEAPTDFNGMGAAEGKRMLPSRFIVLEKVPLFVLAVFSSVITFYAQKGGGAVSSLHQLPFTTRFANALVSFINYIVKMVWPRDLSIIYPLDPGMPVWQAAPAVIVLAVVTVLSVRAARRRPYLIVGWLWYLGTLVPVIGLIQVGEQAMADRYTYIPLVGLFVMIVWGISELAAVRRSRQLVAAVAVCSVLAVLAICTRRQLGYWRDSYTLFSHASSVTRDNYTAHKQLGKAFAGDNRADEAVEEFQTATRIRPGFAEAHNNLALAYGIKGWYDKAFEELLIAERLTPADATVHFNLGVAYRRKGMPEEAIRHFELAVRYNPTEPLFRNRLMEMYSTVRSSGHD